MYKVFDKTPKKPENGFTVAVMMNKLKQTKGEVGLEIEVEGKRFPKEDLGKWWTYHHDGSLRGEDNAEYVLTKPIDFQEVSVALEDLWKQFKANKSQIDDSNRTSVHVHLNCQQFHLNRLASFGALWFCFENVFAEWAGDHRVGNLFCLRGKDAPNTVTQFKKFIRSSGNWRLNDNLHYAGFNIHSLAKFGSIEIRFLRGVDNSDVIVKWVAILERLYRLSAEFPDPRDIPALFSKEGPISFFSNVLGGMEPIIREGIPGFDNQRISEEMLDGIRLAQDICYCRDWTLFNPVMVKPDPFNRSMKGIAAKIINATQTQGAEQANGPAYDFAIDLDVEPVDGWHQEPLPPATPQPGYATINLSTTDFAQMYGQSTAPLSNPFTNH